MRGVVGAVEAGPEDGGVGPFVVAVGADGVDEDIGGCAGAAPHVGEIARWVCGRLGRAIILTGNDYIASSDGTKSNAG